jgi:hypothetical protein
MAIRCRDRIAYNTGKLVPNSRIKALTDPRNHDKRPQKTAEQIRAIAANRSL